jgi:uncharacterized membrane protein YebE (DUF533 family)
VLFFSPDTLLSVLPENEMLKKVKENAQMIAFACAAGAGYLYYQSTQKSEGTSSSEPASDLPTYEQSVSSQQ